MKVLAACEYSGTVRDAFTAKGHDAWSCDTLPTESLGQHIQGDVLKILDDGWDLMIAHPPCTYLSNVGAKHMFPKGVLNKDRLRLATEATVFFMQLLRANIPKICIENPIPLKAVGLPDYHQCVDPSFFGEAFQKKTCLWFKNLPPLISTLIVANPEPTTVVGNWYNKCGSGGNRQKARAKFFPGMARAMAEQWG